MKCCLCRACPHHPAPVSRSLRQLWGERGGRGHRLHGHGPGLPRRLLCLHDLQHQAARQALLCRGEEGLLRALLHSESLFISCFFSLFASTALFFYGLQAPPFSTIEVLKVSGSLM